jgi:hypothetical protein
MLAPASGRKPLFGIAAGGGREEQWGRSRCRKSRQKIKGAQRVNAERPEGSPPPELPDCNCIVPLNFQFVNTSQANNWLIYGDR